MPFAVQDGMFATFCGMAVLPVLCLPQQSESRGAAKICSRIIQSSNNHQTDQHRGGSEDMQHKYYMYTPILSIFIEVKHFIEL